MASPYAASRGEMVTAMFWERLAKGQMEVQRCLTCAHVRFPPNKMCPQCHGVDYAWLPVSGTGTLWSHTTVRVPPSPELAAEVPYRLGVVELAEGPMVLGRVTNLPGDETGDREPVIGMALTLVIDPDPDGGVPRYHFEAAR